ncbi:hypothetical protein IWZ01DRAFT_529442 [Phyllosticta capitalensis]
MVGRFGGVRGVAARRRLAAAAAALDASGASGRRVEGSKARENDEANNARAQDCDAAEKRKEGKRRSAGDIDVSKEKRLGGLTTTTKAVEDVGQGTRKRDIDHDSKGGPNSNSRNSPSEETLLDSGNTSSSRSLLPRFNSSAPRRLSTTNPNEDQQPVAVAPQRIGIDVDHHNHVQQNHGSPSTRGEARPSTLRVSFTRPGTASSSGSGIAATASRKPLPSSPRSPRPPSELVSVPVAPRTQEEVSLLSWSTDPGAGIFISGDVLPQWERIDQSSAEASASGRSSSLPDVRNHNHRSAGASARATSCRRRSDLAEAPRRCNGPGAVGRNFTGTSNTREGDREKQTGPKSSVSSRLRHKHSSLLRRAYTLPTLSNASLLSVFSELTHSSESTNTSSGSNSTITQQSYERSTITKRRRPSKRDGNGSVSRRPKHSDFSEASSSKLVGEGGGDPPKRRRRHSNPLACDIVESGASFIHPASAHSSMEEVATTRTISGETATPRPVLVDHERIHSDSGISMQGGRPNGINIGHSEPETIQVAKETQDDEDTERELAIQRLVREIAQSPQLMAGADARLHKLMEQEEQLRLHISKPCSAEHPAPRDEPHFRSNNGGDGASGMFPYCRSSETRQGATCGCCEDPPGRPALVPASDPSYHADRAPGYSQYQPLAQQFAFSGGGGQHYQTELAEFGRTTIAGYEKMAMKLAEGPDPHPGDDDEHDAEKGRAREGHVRPLYRRFEYLQHRILLHIQDELSELEEKLSEMDKWIAQQSALRDQQGMAAPASRRLEARYGNDVHTRRTLLLGEIFVKLGQYNSAMTAYANLVATLAPAQKTDMAAYESWIREHAPIDAAETRFLARHADLGTVSLGVHQRHGTDGSRSSSGIQRRHVGNNMNAPGEGFQYSAVWGILVLLLLPLVTFSQSRVVVVVAAFAAAAVVASSSSTRFNLSSREVVACACTNRKDNRLILGQIFCANGGDCGPV